MTGLVTSVVRGDATHVVVDSREHWDGLLRHVYPRENGRSFRDTCNSNQFMNITNISGESPGRRSSRRAAGRWSKCR